MKELNIGNLESIIVHSIDLISLSDKKVDIINITTELIIVEEIDNFVVLGSIIIVDTIGFFEYFPVVGGETINIRFQTNQSFEIYEKSFNVTKIGREERLSKSVTHEYLKLYFSSPPLLENFKRKFSKSYSHTPIHEIVNDVFRNQLGGESLDLEETQNVANFVIPYLNPFRTIQIMSRKAISARYNDSGYLFFENRLGFHWISMSSLLQQEVQERHINLHKVVGSDDSVDSPHTSKYIGDAKDFKFTKVLDISESIKSGALGATIYTFDYANKCVVKRTIDWRQYQDNTWNLGSKSFYTDSSFYPESNVSEFTNYLNDKIINEFEYPNIIYNQSKNELRDFNRLHFLNNYILLVNKRGDSDLTCGQKVLVKYMSRDSGKRWHDRFFGEYLVKSIKHVISLENGYTQVVALLKESFDRDSTGILSTINNKRRIARRSI